jgi:hypothetical protein
LYLTNISLCFYVKDWPNHKPFCKPGAPSSINNNNPVFPAVSSRQGALRIPITGPDGKTTLLSSSSMSAEMLKEIKELSEGKGENSIFKF